MSKIIEDRLIALDKKCGHLSGFTLSRAFNPKGLGLIWVIGMGRIGMPKVFFNGLTLEEAISKAETYERSE